MNTYGAWGGLVSWGCSEEVLQKEKAWIKITMKSHQFSIKISLNLICQYQYESEYKK